MTTGPIRLNPDDPGQSSSIQEIDSPGEKEASSRTRLLRWVLPFAVVGFAFFIFWALVATREAPVKIEPVVVSPLVRILTATPEDVRLTVISRGTVIPRTESDLVAEVRGRIIEGSPHLVEGGFFDTGDVLLRLDDREYRIALDRARANVSLRESQARLARADAGRRRELARQGAASAADLEQFESRELVAKAALQEARAIHEQAELDLEHTIVRAPFDGRVRERSVDVGQFVTPGAKLGRIFAVDYSEVRLPIRADELVYLDESLDFAGSAAGFIGAPVVLSARLGGRELTWPARIERAEAAIDPQTRMLNLVARVDDPYLLAGDPADIAETSPVVRGDNELKNEAPSPRTPLPPGLFVTAEIEGRALADVFVLPVMALRDHDQVFVLDDESRLRVRDVSVVRRGQGRVVIDSGIEAGERVVVSPIRIYSEGMQLRAIDSSAP